MTETTTEKPDLPEATNENWYEFAWRFREHIVDQIIAGGPPNFNAVFDQFVRFEANHFVHVYCVDAVSPETQEELGRYLTGNIKAERSTQGDGIAEAIKLKNLFFERVKYLASRIDDDTDVVIELGCGWGVNLLLLHEIERERKFPLVGAEYTESGRRLFGKLAALKGMTPKIAFIDHRAPDLGFLKDDAQPIRKAFVFTCHSIEQVDFLPANYFHALAAIAPEVRGVHLEPFGFQLDASTSAAKKHKAWCEDNKWNQNFHETLKGAERDGALAIEHQELNRYSLEDGNPTSVAIWRKT